MIREIAVAAACAILVLEGMFTLRFRCKASRHGRRRPNRRL